MKKLIILLFVALLIACSPDESTNNNSGDSFNLSTIAVPSNGGNITPSSGVYESGESVTLNAIPAENFVFKNWAGGAFGINNPTTTIINSDTEVLAIFEDITTLDSDGDGVPDINDLCPNTPNGAIVDSNGCLVYVYLDNNGVTVKAAPYAIIGDTGVINSELYTVVSENQLRQMIENDEDYSKAVTTFVTYMSELFKSNCFAFTQPGPIVYVNYSITSWDTSNVTDMSEMFRCQYLDDSFNQDISNWDTTNVLNMHGMFYKAEVFNQDVGSWDTGNVTDMSRMFFLSDSFNQDIGNWDTSNVSAMESMFSGAASFNQNLSGWCVSNIRAEPFLFSPDSPLTNANKPIWGTCP